MNLYTVSVNGRLVAIRATRRTYTHALADENGAYQWFGRPELAHAHKRRYPLAHLAETKSVSQKEYLEAGKTLAKQDV
jgi:hypothetical protein